MREILPGVHHWTTLHEGIGQRVHSYYLSATEPAVLIDPRVPAQGLEAFRAAPPRHAYLTNRHHYRHSDRFAAAFGTEIWCHTAGLHEFSRGEKVTAFQHGDVLPSGVQALAVGVLCPEETALYIPLHDGILALGDAIIREHGALAFVPDPLMGDDPAAVRRGLAEVFRNHLEREFDHLLFAHGAPWIGGAKEGLRRFLDSL
ncbi:MAG TPA: hypothetical protein VFY81_01305 [Gammaproteobacteria bacterium]|nr:hypothetical protein [Gammaproteobacteria bacterium]